jgi:hypothetical protein
MFNRPNVAVYNGRVLPDDSPVDFVLWARGRDFEIIEAPDAVVLACLDRHERERLDHRRHRTKGDGRNDSISGWFIVPDPA